MNKNANTQAGMHIALAQLGLDNQALKRMEANHAVMQSDEAAPFHKELAKIAAAAYDATGDFSSPNSILFRNLATTDRWFKEYNKFTNSVSRSLSKQAMTMALPAIAHDSIGGGVVKNILTAGGIGGMTVGALAFLLSRNARQSSSGNRELLEKIRTYKKLTNDINEDMYTQGNMEANR